MKTLMKTLMTQRNSRNLCRRAKHQVRALVNLRMDKTPAQGVHESGHEGFMMSEQVCGVGPCGCTDRTIRTDKTPAQGVHDCIHEPLRCNSSSATQTSQQRLGTTVEASTPKR